MISETRRYILLIIIIQLLLPFPFLWAQELIWVTVEGTAPINGRNKEDAKTLAIKEAEEKAVKQAISENVSAETLLVNLRLSGNILGAIPFGRVVEREILEEGVINIHKKKESKSTSVYKIKLKAGVAEETEEIDPDFMLNTSLNKSGFKDGDEIQIRVTSKKDCYISIFNILEDEKIIRIIPNKYKRKNRIKANQTFIFPDKIDKINGSSLIAHVPDGKDLTSESFLILALKRPLKLGDENIQEAVFGVYNGKTAFMNELIKNIAVIPMNERGEDLLHYEIKRN